MLRPLTLLSLTFLLACEKPALHALEDRIAAIEADLGTSVSGDDTGSSGDSPMDVLDETVTDLGSTVETLGSDLAETNEALAAAEERITALEGSELAAAGTVVGLMSETIPEGYLMCDGSSLAIADYPDLYAVIGSQFGSEDSLSFNLPDLRGEFLRGLDAGAGGDLGAAEREDRGDGTTGDAVGTWQDEDIGSASYSISYDITTTSTGCVSWSGDCQDVLSSASLSSAEGEDAEVRPHNVSVVWVIKY